MQKPTPTSLAPTADDTASVDPGDTDSAEPLPQTCDEAVDFVIRTMMPDEAIEAFRHTPKWDIGKFHRFFGMGIRNRLGLWRDRESPLVASCMEKDRGAYPSPDSISGVITEGIWDKLNDDIARVDYGVLPPADYFPTLHRDFQKIVESKNDRMLATFPPWFLARGYERQPRPWLIRRALALVETPNELSWLAALYLTFARPQKVDFDIHPLLDDHNLIVRYPIVGRYYIRQLGLRRYARVNPETLPEISINDYQNSENYYWRQFTLPQFVLALYSREVGANLYTRQDYEAWQRAVINETLLRFSFKESVADRDFAYWAKNRIVLLRILVLSKKYVYFNEGNDYLPHGLHAGAEPFFQQLVDWMKNELGGELPQIEPASHISCSNSYVKRTWRECDTVLSIMTLQHLASTIDAKSLLQLMSKKEVVRFSKMRFKEALHPYAYLAIFLLVTQSERFKAPNLKKVAWETYERFLNQEENLTAVLSAGIYHTVAKRQFAVDSERTVAKILKDLASEINAPECGSALETEERLWLLNEMLDEGLEQYKSTIESWYRILLNNCPDSYAEERAGILDAFSERGKAFDAFAAHLKSIHSESD